MAAEGTQDGCPVPREQRQRFLKESPLRPAGKSSSSDAPLSNQRVVSSIPRLQDDAGHWVYPSQAQFFKALQRKEHDPSAGDMSTVVPIHNAVNERAWRDILSWEREVGAGDDARRAGAGRPRAGSGGGSLTPD